MSSADVEQQEQAPEVDAASEIDAARQQQLDELNGALGDAIVGSHVHGGDLWVRVRREDWRRTAEACKGLGYDYFCFLSGIDWMPSAPNAEDAETASVEPDADEDEAPAPEPAEGASEQQHEEATPAGAVATEETTDDEGAAAAIDDEGWTTGWAGGDTRFQVLARLHSTTRHVGVTLKADLDDENPGVASIHDIFFGADWHERETWEMYGFVFEGHPHLAHIYLPGEFEGFPLRKDFPLLSREVKPWPGIVDVEDLPPAEEARQDAAIQAAAEPAEGEQQTEGGG